VWRIQDRRDLRYDILGDITLTMSTAIKLLAAMRLNPLSVPAHRPVKAIYIRRFVALIDQIQE
jgi:hypothetical protein